MSLSSILIPVAPTAYDPAGLVRLVVKTDKELIQLGGVDLPWHVRLSLWVLGRFADRI